MYHMHILDHLKPKKPSYANPLHHCTVPLSHVNMLSLD